MKYFKITLLLLLLIAPFIINAQFKFGVAGGLNTSSFIGKNGSDWIDIGFNAGLMMEIKLPTKFGVEVDLLYSHKGGGVDTSVFDNVNVLQLNYIDIPITVKLYFFKVLNFQLGVQPSVLMSAKYKFHSGELDAKKDVKPIDFSGLIGFGIDVSRFHFSARYNIGLLSIDDTSYNADVKNCTLNFAVGIWLKK